MTLTTTTGGPMALRAIPKKLGLIDVMALIADVALIVWVTRPDFVTPRLDESVNLVARFLVFLTLSGVLGSFLAGIRGGTRFGGFALGFMLGPVGLFMATSLGPSSNVPARSDREARP